MSISSQDDNIIKNPLREQNKNLNQEMYIPEYIKHGKYPKIQDFPSLDGEIIAENEENCHVLNNVEYIPHDSDLKYPVSKNKIPNIGDFVLMVHGKVILHGDHNQILSMAKAILYGEHPNFINTNIKVEDVILLKRIALKVGVFLDE